jgi:endonuclease/exonuclease/phosphatase family metal-dependent hydrolase
MGGNIWMAALAGLAAGVSAQPPLTAPAEAAAAPADLSVMTYNIEGLPFPVRRGRAAAADRIASQLRAMRDAGTAPHVVVLQEAFGHAQKAIGREAGYRYIAFGPGRRATNDETEDAADRAFAAGARHLKGEDDGKWAGSGLAILSDYPILSVARAAFPRFACAGLDCLANKGVLLATVAVPGSARPVSVVATHMNSKEASGVAPARFGWAYDRQVRSIGRFLAANLDPAAPYVFAGDTNIGRSPTRTAAFEAMLSALPRVAREGKVRTALATCLAGDAGCRLDDAREARRSFRHGKDWEVYAPGADMALRPVAIATPFGHDAHGTMLSDHIGYTATYRFTPGG